MNLAGRVHALLAGLVLSVAAMPCSGFAQPAAAPEQNPPGGSQGDGESQLQALIPDTAVAKPADWAAGSAGTTPTAPPPGSPPTQPVTTIAPVDSGPLNPSSSIAELRGFSVSWPDMSLDLPELAALPPDSQSTASLPSLTDLASTPASVAAPDRTDRPSRVDRLTTGRIVLAWHDEHSSIPERAELEARFRALSTLQAMRAKEADVSDISVRAATDRVTLERLLRVYGYYDAEVSESLAAPSASPVATTPASAQNPVGKTGPMVRFEIVPGERYRFGAIDLGQIIVTGPDYPTLRKSFGIVSGDPLHLDAIPAETTHLTAALGESGYVFAHIDPPSLVVDHLREEGDLTLPVTPGAKYRFGQITSANPRFLSSRHLARIARFHPGQIYKQSAVEDLRRAILATGLVSSLTVTPREVAPPKPAEANAPATPGTVGLDVAMTPAPPRTVSGAIGYDTAQGFRLETGWEHRNLFPPEGSLRLRGVAGTNEQLAGVTLRRANFLGRDRVLTFDLYADNATLPAYAARGVDFTATYERQTTVIFQKPWSWSVGLEAEDSDEREGVPSGIITGRTAYVTFAAPLHATWDRSDDLLNPSHGYRVGVRVSPEMSEARGVTSTYLRSQLDASWYQPLFGGVVLASRLRLGSIFGTGLENIAPSRRYYAGGGGSIRGFGYELVGPRNSLDQPEGARSLYEVSMEARINTGLFDNSLALVPFLDTGGAGTGTVPDFGDVRYGAGLGFRYETGFGPVRLDVGTPLDPRPGDSRIGVYVTLGQAF